MRSLLDGRLFFLLCFVAAARQWTWAISSMPLAWGLAIAIGSAVFYHFREEMLAADEESPGRTHVLAVVLPIILLWLYRLPFIHLGCDVLSYHLTNAEHALRAAPFQPGDYGSTHYNVLPDMVSGIARYLLGLRAGTAYNLLALVAVAAAANRLLHRWITDARARAGGVLLCLTSEFMLIELHGYYGDMLGVPLVLEAFDILCFRSERLARRRTPAYLGLLCGVAMALKLSNVVFFLPLLLAAAPRARFAQIGGCALWALAAFVPHHACAYLATGNPLFPLWNHVFVVPDVRVTDPAIYQPYNPNGLLEWIAYPFVMLKPLRASELPYYGGHMTLGFLAAPFLLSRGATRRAGVVFLAGLFFWAKIAGNLRYGAAWEVVGTLLVLAAVSRLRFLPRAAGWGLVMIASAVSCYSYSDMVAPWHNAAGPGSVAEWLAAARDIFHDHDMRDSLASRDRMAVDAVEAWVAADYFGTAAMELLRPELPFVHLIVRENYVPGIDRHFARALGFIDGKRAATICPMVALEECRTRLAGSGFYVTQTRALDLPIHTKSYALLSLTRTRPRDLVRRLASRDTPLAREGANAIFTREGALESRAGSSLKFLRVHVRNAGFEPWPAHGSMPVRLGGRLYDGKGEMVKELREVFPEPVDAGAGRSLTMRVDTALPAGDYRLLVNVVQEMAFWFDDIGVKPLEVAFTVQR